jgi:hypothetical protein
VERNARSIIRATAVNSQNAARSGEAMLDRSPRMTRVCVTAMSDIWPPAPSAVATRFTDWSWSDVFSNALRRRNLWED